MKFTSTITKTVALASILWALSLTAAWAGYGGELKENEYVNGDKARPTDYKNPLPDQGTARAHHYHVTICNDGNWYGVWNPPEWKGNKGGVTGSPDKNGQHGYAKQEDGTGGGVQVMGNGAGGDTIEIKLEKAGGQTVYLTIHVIHCGHENEHHRGVEASAANPFTEGASDQSNSGRRNHGGGPNFDIGIGVGPGGGIGIGIGPEGGGIGFDFSTGGYCDRWGCPGDYWGDPVFYGPVYFGGEWYDGPVYYREYDGEYEYWVHGGWHRDEWRGERPNWARNVHYGPALGHDYYRSDEFPHDAERYHHGDHPDRSEGDHRHQPEAGVRWDHDHRDHNKKDHDDHHKDDQGDHHGDSGDH